MRFKLTRRSFALGLGASIVAAAGVYKVNKPTNQNRQEAALTLFDALIDTILPSDESPGALDLNLQHRLNELARAQPRWAQRIELLESEVNKRSLSRLHAPFATQDLDTRETLLSELSQERSVQAGELRRLRNKLFDWYYASPQGHASLAYTLPSHYPAY